MQDVGIVDGSARYAAQSGVGAADPTQVNSDCPLLSPVALSAVANNCGGAVPRNSPQPPRRVSGGGPNCDSPMKTVKPARGLTWISDVRLSVLRAKIASTSGLYSGLSGYREPSARKPYVRC